jgi:hypothetical protein
MSSPTISELLAKQLYPGILPERKITAIKALRECSTLGLKDAKDAVELVMGMTHENVATNMMQLATLLKSTTFVLPFECGQFINALFDAGFPEYRICELTAISYPNVDRALAVGRVRQLQDAVDGEIR